MGETRVGVLFEQPPLCSAATHRQPMPSTRLQRWHGRMQGMHWSCCGRPLVEKLHWAPCPGGECSLPWMSVLGEDGQESFPVSSSELQKCAAGGREFSACLRGGDGDALWRICFPPRSPRGPACSWVKGFNSTSGDAFHKIWAGFSLRVDLNPSSWPLWSDLASPSSPRCCWGFAHHGWDVSSSLEGN